MHYSVSSSVDMAARPARFWPHSLSAAIRACLPKLSQTRLGSARLTYGSLFHTSLQAERLVMKEADRYLYIQSRSATPWFVRPFSHQLRLSQLRDCWAEFHISRTHYLP